MESLKRKDLPAFPIDPNELDDSLYYGLTRRDYFIAAALPGVIISLNRNQLIQAANLEAARGAIRVADAVLAEAEVDEEVPHL